MMHVLDGGTKLDEVRQWDANWPTAMNDGIGRRWSKTKRREEDRKVDCSPMSVAQNSLFHISQRINERTFAQTRLGDREETVEMRGSGGDRLQPGAFGWMCVCVCNRCY